MVCSGLVTMLYLDMQKGKEAIKASTFQLVLEGNMIA